MLWIFLICTLAVYFYLKVKKSHSFWAERGVKYIKPNFFVGNMDVLQRTPFVDKVLQMYKYYPEERYHGLYMFLQPALMIKDPELVKQITVKAFDHFMDHRSVVSSDIDPVWGRSLINSAGEKWRDLRTTLSPSFTSNKMKIMYNLINECALQFVDYFKSNPLETVEIELKDTFSRYTNDVVATIAFGLKCDSLRDKDNEFYRMGKQIATIDSSRFLRFFAHDVFPTISRLLKIKIIPTRLADYFSAIIKETVEARETQKIVRPDMIHLLLEAQKGRLMQEEDVKVSEGFSTVSESDMFQSKRKQQITMDDIIAQAFIFFLAGFETISTMLSLCFYELALNPDIQNRLRAEIQEMSDRITYENLFKMKYLDMVVSETLRKWAPGFLTDREVTKDFTIDPVRPGEKPVHLTKGMVVWLPNLAIHRDTKYYPEPEKFDPERFSEENKHKINPIMYMPFGSGPRNCIGSRFALLEAKVFIFHVLRSFELVPVKKTPIPFVLDPKVVGLHAKGGLWLGLKKL